MCRIELSGILLVSFAALCAATVPQSTCNQGMEACPESQSTPEEVAQCHHKYEDMVSVMQQVAATCPEITHLDVARHENGSAGTSFNGRELNYIIFSDNPSGVDSRKSNILTYSVLLTIDF